jgi:hypothetical protein
MLNYWLFQKFQLTRNEKKINPLTREKNGFVSNLLIILSYFKILNLWYC